MDRDYADAAMDMVADFGRMKYHHQYRFPPQRWQWPNYSGLPVQSIPSLKSSMGHMLRFAKPLLSQQEYQETELLVSNFLAPGGEGEQLQALLEKRATELENWLAEWWLDHAYLTVRQPLPVNVTPGLTFPPQNFRGQNGQVNFAAHLVEALLYFKRQIDNKSMKEGTGGSNEMDMSQYDLLFGTHRIPGISRDSLRYASDSAYPADHIIVIRNGHLFAVPVYDSSLRPLSRDQLAVQLQWVCRNSDSKCIYPVGILTAEHRTTWGKIYDQLKRNKVDSWILDSVERALFVLCLDKAEEIPNEKTMSDSELKEIKLKEMGKQLLHGKGMRHNGGNRWYDKTLQIIVSEDGMCGLAYEHSPAEGPPIAALMDATVEYCRSDARAPRCEGVIKTPIELKFTLSDDIKVAIEEAGRRLDAVARDLEVNIFSFNHFGKDVPKSFRLSPDGFIQLAIQLAYFKCHKEIVPTYETGTLRRFKLGRTDTIRLPTEESVEFVLAMESQEVGYAEKARLLRRAAASHKEYTRLACSGKGMDRHLLGLKKMATEGGKNVPRLLSSSGFTAMNHYKLSTSQVPAKQDESMVFGPMFPDCYGVCYNPQEKKINISVTAFNSFPSTSAHK